MRSVLIALSWEMLSVGGWFLAGALLLCLGFPSLILGALMHGTGLPSDDPSLILIHCFLVQINAFIFGAALLHSVRQTSRLYAAPISSTTLVLCQLGPAMVLMFAEMLLTSTAINSIYRLEWPVLGPALFAVVAYACVQAVIWQTERTVWIFWGLTVIPGGLGIWLLSRYHILWSKTPQLWTEVTLLEFTTLAMIGVGAVAAAIRGISRLRCGEEIRSWGIVDAINRLLDPRPEEGPPFQSGIQAHAWMEMYKKGWITPAGTAFGIVMGLIMWGIANRRFEDLIEGQIAGGALVSAVAMVGGIVFGNVGSNDKDYEMSQFLATRPLTVQQMSAITLKTMAISSGLSWLIWFTFAGLTVSVLYLNESTWLANIQLRHTAWYLPTTLLAPWVVLGICASVGLTGRPIRFVSVGVIAFLAFIALNIWSDLALTLESRKSLMQAIGAGTGCALAAGASWIFYLAWRQSLITARILTWSVLAWIAVACLSITMQRTMMSPLLTINILFAGLASLVVIPMASVPLALTWNRHR